MVILEEGQANDAQLVQSQHDEEHPADPHQPDAVPCHQFSGIDQHACRPECQPQGDEHQGETENVGDGIDQQSGSRGCAITPDGDSRQPSQEDRQQRQHTRGGNREHPSKKGGDVGDIGCHEPNRTTLPIPGQSQS